MPLLVGKAVEEAPSYWKMAARKGMRNTPQRPKAAKVTLN